MVMESSAGPSSGRGRPPKIIDKSFLADALSSQRNISKSQLARSLKIDRKTLSKNVKASNLPTGFSSISSDQLDEVIRNYKLERPSSGLRFVTAHLRNSDMKVQRQRIRDSLARVDGLATQLRKSTTVQRRTYFSLGPNQLWHGDGHHKLIRYAIVIHGFIDGYDRMVSELLLVWFHILKTLGTVCQITGLRASGNNRADTVLHLFEDANERFGCPSRCRGDRGGENLLVALFMIMKRGPNRASFMWGS
jgi:hypothetical protein